MAPHTPPNEPDDSNYAPPPPYGLTRGDAGQPPKHPSNLQTPLSDTLSTPEAWDPQQMARLRAKIQDLQTADHPDWTEDDLIAYLRYYKNNKASTIQSRLRQLRFMADYEAQPVAIHGSKTEIVTTFAVYVAHRRTNEGVPPSTLTNDFKAIRSLGDLLGIPPSQWPTAPTPNESERDIPSPEQVYNLLHTDYLPNAKRNYKNALIKYLLALDFGYGIRFPSEAYALTVDDLDLEDHWLRITEPKKGDSTRRVAIEPEWLCCSKRHKSLLNWLKWRTKTNPTTDALFPKPNGERFASKHTLRNVVVKHVKDEYPWFYPYLGRHWSVNARLIEWDFDYVRVAQWHGHEDVNTTKNNYEQEARLHRNLYGDRWLIRAFQKLPTNQ